VSEEICPRLPLEEHVPGTEGIILFDVCGLRTVIVHVVLQDGPPFQPRARLQPGRHWKRNRTVLLNLRSRLLYDLEPLGL
jgi:hypothetical protein